MNPGQLDRLLVLLTRTVNNDAAGSPVETWATAGNVWARRVTVAGSEPTNNGATRSAVSSSYLIRYRADLAAADAAGKYRVRVDGRDHDIVSALEDPANPRRSALILSLAYSQGEPTLTA